MIPASVIRLVERLLALGNLSRRAIAAKTGVSKSTVCEVAAGRITSADRHAREKGMRPARRNQTAIPEQRCPVCGAMCVEAPCRTCLVRNLVRRGDLPPHSPMQDYPPVGLELRPEELARYERCRRRKPGCGEADDAA